MATAHETLLGFCDAIIDGKKNASTYFTNKIGDIPDCYPSVSLNYPCCALCGTVLAHVVQVYCPLQASPYHRIIHVFACTRPQCYGISESWKVLRSQCLESEMTAAPVAQESQRVKKKEVPMATSDWCEGADDWGSGEEKEEEEEEGVTSWTSSVPKPDISGRLQGLSLTDNLIDRPCRLGLVLPDSVPTFQPHYISVVEESDLDGPTDMKDAHRLLQEYEKREGVAVGQLDSCGGEGEPEKYEKTKARHGDKVFSRFMKRISLCPEQILRYCWNGSPLFITEPSSNVAEIVPPCGCCGSHRVFEFQLMPALVSLLSGVNSELALEFGTALVYTCRSSCWSSGSDTPVEEFLLVQKDPDHKLFI